MTIIAKIAEYEISEADIAIDADQLNICKEHLIEAKIDSLNRLIDSFLLYQEACSLGIEASEEEFDEYFLQCLADFENKEQPLSIEEARNLELKITRKIVVGKYLTHLWKDSIEIDDQQLHAFYEEHKEVFTSVETVRASHVLVGKNTPHAKDRADSIRANIKGAEDFEQACAQCSDCPTCNQCGDLGYFRRGEITPAIEDMAFSMNVGDISPVFPSHHGYHILMLTDRKEPEPISFEEIKDKLKARLIALEREFFLQKHIQELRERHRSLIQILDKSYLKDL